jgi:flagellar L-ring protein precursor FlgH
MYAIRNYIFIASLFVLATGNISCASFGETLKGWMGGNDTKPNVNKNPAITAYSNNPNVPASTDRKYRRTTKDNFGEDQGLEESSGSLWRKEGQASYLFSQNNLRMMGDIINVDVEGKTADNLSSKLAIIKQNLAKIEAPQPAQRKNKGVPRPDSERQPAEAAPATPPPSFVADAPAAEGEKSVAEKKFDTVPCRITERNPDGSYRVKGQTSVYVGRHEYRLIVTGLVRPEDVTSDNIASTKLMDSKFDLVASNKEVK